MEFKKGELFCGPGGIALGAHLASARSKSGELFSIRHEWANDIDSSACETYITNICPENPQSVICQDVRALDIESLPPIDAFSFGFPCNDYSIVGEQKGLNGDFGPLYSYGIQVLDYHNPLFFIAENVGGLQSANNGEAFTQILIDLAKAGQHGYKLTPHLYKFEQYGIPQKRHRIIIVGIRNDFNLSFQVPKPKLSERHFVTAKEALENPPIPENAPNNERTQHNKRVVEMLSHIPPGKNAWYDGIPENLRLNVKATRLSQIYKRLHPDEPAYTITGSGGGGTHCYHWQEPRALTNRERARLQSFPDDFIFCGSKEAVRKQIGMAVPPKGAELIFNAVLMTFAGISYPSVVPKWDMMELDELTS